MWFAMLRARLDKHISGGRATCNKILRARRRRDRTMGFAGTL